MFPKTFTDSSEEEIMVATFVNKYADDVSDELFRQVLAFRSCAPECVKTAQANKKNVKELLNFIIQLELISSFHDSVASPGNEVRWHNVNFPPLLHSSARYIV